MYLTRHRNRNKVEDDIEHASKVAVDAIGPHPGKQQQTHSLSILITKNGNTPESKQGGNVEHDIDSENTIDGNDVGPPPSKKKEGGLKANTKGK